MGQAGSGWALIPGPPSLEEEGNWTQTGGRRPCAGAGRASEACTSQGTAVQASHHQQAGEAEAESLLGL